MEISKSESGPVNNLAICGKYGGGCGGNAQDIGKNGPADNPKNQKIPRTSGLRQILPMVNHQQ